MPLSAAVRRLDKGFTVDGLPEEMKPVAPGVFWDSKRDTFYVRAMGVAPSDISGYIIRFQQALEADPQNTVLRFLLSQYLERDGRGEQARAELQAVAQSGEVPWADKARQALGAESEQPDA